MQVIFLMALQPLWALASFQFPDLFTTGRTPWTSDRPVARTTQTMNKRTYTPNIHSLSGIRTHDHGLRASECSSCLRPRGYCDRLASERAKTVHALDRSATVTGRCKLLCPTKFTRISIYDTGGRKHTNVISS
jgi:hypothetical protein